MWLLIVQRIILDFLWHIVYFPIWWYTGGIKYIIVYCFGLFRTGNDYLAPGLWLRNILVPMFGQNDWQGRIVSVFMRIVNIIGRSIALFVWTMVVLAIFVMWIVWPAFITYLLVVSF